MQLQLEYVIGLQKINRELQTLNWGPQEDDKRKIKCIFVYMYNKLLMQRGQWD